MNLLSESDATQLVLEAMLGGIASGTGPSNVELLSVPNIVRTMVTGNPLSAPTCVWETRFVVSREIRKYLHDVPGVNCGCGEEPSSPGTDSATDLCTDCGREKDSFDTPVESGSRTSALRPSNRHIPFPPMGRLNSLDE